MKNLLLENLSSKLVSEVSSRRYSLPEMISESYKALYACEKGSNLQKLAESHLADVKENPTEIERLSRNLSTLKEITKLVESGKVKDRELKERPKLMQESRNLRGRKLRGRKLKESSNPHEGWEYWEMPKGYKGPWTAKHYAKDYMDLYLTIYPPQEVPMDEPAEDWAASIDDAQGDNHISEYKAGFNSFEEAEAWINKWLDRNGYNIEESRNIRGRKSESCSPLAKECDSPRKRDLNDSENHSFASRPRKKDLEEDASTPEINNPPVDDEDLTDEEVAELAKYLEKIRKEKKVSAPAKTEDKPESKEGDPAYKAPVKEESNPRKGIRCKTHEACKETSNPRKGIRCKTHEACKESKGVNEGRGNEQPEMRVGDRVGKGSYGDTEYRVTKVEDPYVYILRDPGNDYSKPWKVHKSNISVIKRDGKIIYSDTGNQIHGIHAEESKSYSDMKEGLKSFSESSSTKAFYKTFKKMHESLKEGNALTRKESIDLYKAANSAMTQMSIELEHNPEFLTTFNECTTLLSADVSSILGALNEGKAPSKKTMKSLAKFYESLLMEAEDEDDEENIPTEDEVDTDDDFVGDDEGDIESEESEEFNQEYADARVELHKELVANHADSEDPEVQEKIEQDAAEVVNLPGITNEQIAEIQGETPEETPDEEEPEDDEDPIEDEDEISDDELEELKRYLKEMRENKKSK